MDPYKFNSYIRLIISLLSCIVFILVSLLLPLFVIKTYDLETKFGIILVNPYGEDFISWNKFKQHICNRNESFIIILINFLIIVGLMIHFFFRKHPETNPKDHKKYCNMFIFVTIGTFFINIFLINSSLFFFNNINELGDNYNLHFGYYIIHLCFLSHILIIIFLQRDKMILKCVRKLEFLPWVEKRANYIYNSHYHDNLISPEEMISYRKQTNKKKK